MPSITSLQQYNYLITNRPTHTTTYQIDDAIATEALAKANAGLRQMTDAEGNSTHTTPPAILISVESVVELAKYLDEATEQLQGPFYVDPALQCACGRQMTFTDFVSTVIESGLHDKKMIADILCGRAGTWITIGGKASVRSVRCCACDESRTYMNHNYSGGTYAYA